MGYSARYHAFSIIAVFAALALGIVIGAGFGDNLVGGATKSLEESLKQDVRDSRAQQDELSAQLQREQDFGHQIYPDLVAGKLRGDRVGLVALGELPGALASDVQAAIEPTGATISEVAVVRLPPDAGQVGAALEGTRLGRVATDPALLNRLGRKFGQQLSTGGPLLVKARAALLDRFSGRPGGVDHLVLMRSVPTGLDDMTQRAVDDFESGIVAGVRASGVPAVGVERTDASPSSVDFFDAQQIPTVDDVDLTSGKVAMIYALIGAQGNFGVKDTADSLLPQLLLGTGSRRGSAAGP